MQDVFMTRINRTRNLHSGKDVFVIAEIGKNFIQTEREQSGSGIS